MRILIIGAGESGAHLAETLCADGHDLVVVDRNPDLLAELESRNDLMTLAGDGANPGVLEQAGVDKVDLVVALTNHDATNLLACIFAHGRGVKRTVARVSAMEYLSGSVDLAALGVDLVVNPYHEYARDLYNVLRMPGASEVQELLDGRVLVAGMTVHMDSTLNGRKLGDFGETERLDKIRFVALVRGGDVQTPRGETVLMVGDQVYFAGEPDDVEEFMQWAHPEHDAFHRVVIAGGGELGLLLAQRLEAAKTPVVLMEKDPDRADACSQVLKRALVIKGDALDRGTLEGLGGRREDMAYVAVTGSDEHNIIGCLLAEKLGARFTAAQVGKPEYIAFVESQRLLDLIVNPNLAMTNAILHFVRGRNVSAAMRLAQLPGEVIAVELDERHPWAGKKIRDLKIPAGAVIVTTQRGEEVRAATGSLDLEAGDRAVVYFLPEVKEKLFSLLKLK